LSRDTKHKRRATGGKRPQNTKKRAHAAARPPAMTKIGQKRVHLVRTRGGNTKFRALRLETGNFSWGTEAITRKSRIIDTIYNATSNELVRTKTLVKGSIIQIDATPFRQWYEAHYGLPLGRKKKDEKKEEKKDEKKEDEVKKSRHVLKKLEARKETSQVEQALLDQFGTGRLYACISSRPGQCGRCDGYILEGQELAFYLKKLKAKKGA